MNNQKQTGFTLIELLVVSAIIAILAAMLCPRWLARRAARFISSKAALNIVLSGTFTTV